MRFATDLARGLYRARLARSGDDLRRAQALRHRAFHGRDGLDGDAFDARCSHMLIEEQGSGALVGCFRFLMLATGRAADDSYAAQFYDLAGLAGQGGPLLELGRFCVAAGRHDPDILRLAWAALTREVDANGVTLLFGCASFAGVDPAPYAAAFDLLAARHLGPDTARPQRRAPEVVTFAERPATPPDPIRAMQAMPTLLRSYLAMGGWVSDHAVIDRQMNTLHVLCVVPIATIPPARKRALRAVAADAPRRRVLAR